MPAAISTARLEARISTDLHAMLKRVAELQGRTMTDLWCLPCKPPHIKPSNKRMSFACRRPIKPVLRGRCCHRPNRLRLWSVPSLAAASSCSLNEPRPVPAGPAGWGA